MNLTGAVAGTIMAGAVAGWGLSVWRHSTEPVDYGPTEWDFQSAEQALAIRSMTLPKAVVVGTADFDFGTMPHDSTQSHRFEIRNDGDDELFIELVDTTCKCTVGELEEETVPPGETRYVTLTWTAMGYDPEFRQSALLRTNDPDQPSLNLAVHGQVRLLVRPNPTKLVLSQIVRNEPLEKQIRLYSYRDTDVVVRGQTWSDPATAEFFATDIEPLGPDELDQEQGALGGVKISLRLLPGIPVGPLRQSLQVTTNHDDYGTIEIPIEANVVSDITFVGGRGLDRDRNLLRLGQVNRSQGKSIDLKLLAKGAYRDQLQVTVASTDPADVLQAELGEPVKINDGAVVMFPLRVSVPAGSRFVDRLGSDVEGTGHVVLHTTHPDVPSIELFVSFVTVDQ